VQRPLARLAAPLAALAFAGCPGGLDAEYDEAVSDFAVSVRMLRTAACSTGPAGDVDRASEWVERAGRRFLAAERRRKERFEELYRKAGPGAGRSGVVPGTEQMNASKDRLFLLLYDQDGASFHVLDEIRACRAGRAGEASLRPALRQALRAACAALREAGPGAVPDEACPER
jgi:hypothetical protein